MAGIHGLLLIPLPGYEEKAITSKGSQGSPAYNPSRGSGQTSQGSQRGTDVLPTLPLFPSSDRAVTSSGSVKGVRQIIPSLSFSPHTASSSSKWGGKRLRIIRFRNKSTILSYHCFNCQWSITYADPPKWTLDFCSVLFNAFLNQHTYSTNQTQNFYNYRGRHLKHQLFSGRDCLQKLLLMMILTYEHHLQVSW